MDSHEERFERIERTMEFLVEHDAALSARLDTLAIRVDALAGAVERQHEEIGALTGAVERQHEEIGALTGAVERQHEEIGTIALECRDAVTRMIDIAEGIADAVTVHESRIRRLEGPAPHEAA